MGPTLSFKGLDNSAYYRLVDEQSDAYFDTTGTGNSLNIAAPGRARADHGLPPLLGDGDARRRLPLRPRDDADPPERARSSLRSAFLDLTLQDPVLAPIKLIAEPWDTAGYQVGEFPAEWSEWNGKFRDDVRDFWSGADSLLSTTSQRILGSPDVYQPSRRSPLCSVNFVTAHDGFTLADLTAYNHKHNAANGEDNNDGESDNKSFNNGAEGPDRRPGGERAAAAAAEEPARHPAALGRRADAARRRRDGPHAGRQQQRLLPGQRDLLVRLGCRRHRAARASRSSCSRSAARTRRCARPGTATRRRPDVTDAVVLKRSDDQEFSDGGLGQPGRPHHHVRARARGRRTRSRCC